MHRQEVFEKLHQVFAGKGKKSSTISEYENLDPNAGLRKAREYLGYANRGMEKARSDWAYWIYRGDETLAKVLIGIFSALVRGEIDFPEVPDVQGDVLMDKQATLQKWAEELSPAEGSQE